MVRVDPKKIKTRGFYGFKEAWASSSFVGKVSIVLVLLRMFVWMFLFDILPKMLWRRFKTVNSDMKTIIDGKVWCIYSQQKGAIEGVMTIVKLDDDDDGLLLYNVVNPQDKSIEHVRKLGIPVKYIIVPSPSHDSYAVFWKEVFREAQVICPQNTIDAMEGVVDIAGSCQELLPRLRTDVKLYNNEKNLRVKGELFYTLKLEDGTKIVLGDCGLMTMYPLPNRILSGVVSLLGSPKINPFWNWRCVTNKQGYTSTLRQIATEGPWNVYAPQHGNLLTSSRLIQKMLTNASA